VLVRDRGELESQFLSGLRDTRHVVLIAASNGVDPNAQFGGASEEAQEDHTLVRPGTLAPAPRIRTVFRSKGI
jgi:hypothetical protein